MIEATKAQIPKLADGMTVVVSMNSMPLQIIGRITCLWIKGLFGLSKDPGPKRHPNTWKKEKSKKIGEFMKVEKGSVHHNKYNVCWMKVVGLYSKGFHRFVRLHFHHFILRPLYVNELTQFLSSCHCFFSFVLDLAFHVIDGNRYILGFVWVCKLVGKKEKKNATICFFLFFFS